jgi:DNA replication protein DnaC
VGRPTKKVLDAAIQAAARELKLPSIARDFGDMAAAGTRQKQSLREYLLELLELEVENRRIKRQQRRVKEARFPAVKTLEGFDFARNTKLRPAALAELAECRFIDEARNVIFLGDCGTGKTHLAIALGFAACLEGRRVRFTTVAKIANELIEARDAHELSRTVARYARFELLILDELGYLPLTGAHAELLFQVLSERHEKSSLLLTTNLPFAEWTAVFPDVRLCKALVDRLTHRASILDTGTKSVRLDDSLKATGSAATRRAKTAKQQQRR